MQIEPDDQTIEILNNKTEVEKYKNTIAEKNKMNEKQKTKSKVDNNDKGQADIFAQHNMS